MCGGTTSTDDEDVLYVQNKCKTANYPLYSVVICSVTLDDQWSLTMYFYLQNYTKIINWS